MNEIARLRTEIQARKFTAMDLATAIDQKIRTIKELLSGYPLTKIKNLQIRGIADLAEEAAKLQEKYLGIIGEIELGEKELDDGRP